MLELFATWNESDTIKPKLMVQASVSQLHGPLEYKVLSVAAGTTANVRHKMVSSDNQAIRVFMGELLSCGAYVTPGEIQSQRYFVRGAFPAENLFGFQQS